MSVVHETVRAIAVYGTLATLVLVALYLVLGAFGRGFAAGLRSLAATLLPLVAASFLYLFRRPALERLAAASTLAALAGGLGLGLLTMVALQFFGGGRSVPLAELVVSGCLSVLVFSSAAGPPDRGLVWYYGVLCGVLAYLVVWGVPGSR
jgi:hypothetical protein